MVDGAARAGAAGRPFVVEVLGVAGAGKSTLAANLARRLAELGYAAADSRSTRRMAHSTGARLAAHARALPESARALAFVAAGIAHGDLPLSALSRLGPAFQHARQLQLLVPRLGPDGIIVQEPGRLMDLLTQYVHARRPLDPPAALRRVRAGPPVDAAVVLRATPEVALRHIEARKRGLPRSFRGLDAAGLDAVLRRGDACAATIADACRAAGIATVEIDVGPFDAAAVTERCVAFLAGSLPGRRGRGA
jgi:hypothetical protein